MEDAKKLESKHEGADGPMDSLILFVGVILFYFALQLWILPMFGVST